MDVLIDSGADYGLVPCVLVPKEAYCGRQRYVSGINKGTVLYELADVEFELSGVRLKKRVIVDQREKPSPWCLLPLDLGDVGELQVYLNVLHGGSVCIMTRSQYREETALKNDKDSKVNPWESVHSANKDSTGVVNTPGGNTNDNHKLSSSDSYDSGVDDNSHAVNTNGSCNIYLGKEEEDKAEMMPSAEANELEGGSIELDSSESGRGVLNY